MNPSPLQLERHFFPKVQVDANPAGKVGTANALNCEVELAGAEGDPKRFQVSLRLKMAEVLRKVRANAAGVEFEMLFEVPFSRYEIVLTFLSLLELLRLGRIRAVQKKSLGEIKLFPVEVPES